MNIKPIIFSTTRKLSGGQGYWFESVFSDIYETVTRAKGLTIDAFTVEHQKPFDKIKTRRYWSLNQRTHKQELDVKFTWEWFAKQFTEQAAEQGFNCVVFHTTSYWHNKWGLKGFSGVYRNDTDQFIEIYIKADSEEEFWRILCHELGHFCERTLNSGKNIPTIGCDMEYDSMVHHADYCEGDLDAFFESLDFTAWNTMMEDRIDHLYSLIELYMKIKEILGIIEVRPTYPIDRFQFLNRVSQRFGRPTSSYRSGIHNGIDFALPIGTPVFAPHDGEIYQTYRNHQSMGNALYYKFKIGDREFYMRGLHLLHEPAKGEYKKGEIIGYTGNTGHSSGPHLHVEIARSHIDNQMLMSEKSVRANMLDPFQFFRFEVDKIII